ncbi:E3 ubiquitin-protein ligase arc-1 [Dictyocoela muelleri]|nr:E3 ubiquitin-protein ligase arc-1 [Dictyocoela muelleri]
MEIEFNLKKLLKTQSLQLKKCKTVSTNEQITTFKKTFKYTKKLFCQDIKSGLFPILSVPIDDSQVNHKVFLCEVAVGNYIYANRIYAENFPTPPGFDSYVVNIHDQHKNNLKINSTHESKIEFKENKKTTKEETISDKEESQPSIKTIIVESPLTQYDSLIDENINIQEYSYLIKNPQHILPIAEIEFYYDKKLDQSSGNKCEFCKDENSIMFCHAERASFCKKCDQKIHSNEFTMRHRRVYHKEVGKKMFMNCNFHCENVVDFFCCDCKIPLCTQCRIYGNHANTNHKLISYIDACKSMEKEVKRMDNLKIVKNNNNFKNINDVDFINNYNVDKQIAKLKSELFKFKSNVEHVDNKIDEIYKKVKRDLRQISMHRCQLFNAEILKLVKTKNEIFLLENFLNNVDFVSIVKDFNLIEGLKVIEVDDDSCHFDFNLRLNGDLFIERVRYNKKNTIDEERNNISMDAYIESKEK